MKKLILSLAMIAMAATTTFVACKKVTEGSNQTNKSNKSTNLNRHANSGNVYNSKWTQKLGIESVSYVSTVNDTEHFSILAQSKNVNTCNLNLNNGVFSVKETGNIVNLKLTYHEGSQSNEISIIYTLNKETKEVFDVSNNEIVNDSYFLDEVKNTKLGLVICLYDATYNPSPDEPIQGMRDGVGPGCNRTIMSFRISKSRAITYCGAYTSAFCIAHPDCSPIFGIDTGCLWGDYFCVATQEIHCTGSGCNVPY